VDIFFVISGFLITGILERDLALHRFSLLTFYERRVRRIFPALFAVLLACTVLGLLFFTPPQLRDFGESLLACTGFASNFYFSATAHTATGYFTQTSQPLWLLHTWSLSLEEQFYVFFPPLLFLLHRFARPYKLFLLSTLLALSLAVSIHGVHHTPVHAFYLLPWRAWELLLGSLLALHPVPPLKFAWLRSTLGLAGLLAILYAVHTYTSATPFPGAAALLPCLGTTVLLYAGEGGGSLTRRFLALGPLTFLGAISYSLYLWHWPVILFLEKNFDFADDLSRPSKLLAIAISFILAILSFEFIENPFRTRSRKPARPVLVGVAISAAIALLALFLVYGNGFPQRFNATTRAQLAANAARAAEVMHYGNCSNYQTDPEQMSDVAFCEEGHATHKILIWGDSHAEQLRPLLTQMLQRNELGGRGLVFALSEGCMPAESFNRADGPYHCDAFTRFALQRAAQPDIDTVLFAFSPWWVVEPGHTCLTAGGHCTRILTGEQAWQLFLPEIAQHIHDLQGLGKHFILTVPFPRYRQYIPELENRNLLFERLSLPSAQPNDIILPGLQSDTRTLALQSGATLFDPRAVLCPQGHCTYQRDNVSLYIDQSHISATQIGILHKALLAALNQAPKTTIKQ
jgi:peptidoglycan/LPS O-acetylase OafA/YrhL